MNLLNGHKKVLGVAAAIAAVLSILSWFGGVYSGWTQKVEAAVVMQRMVNANDETLKVIVPKVDACHATNEIQEFRIGQNEKDIASLAKTVEQTNNIVQTYIQTLMREGKVPR